MKKYKKNIMLLSLLITVILIIISSFAITHEKVNIQDIKNGKIFFCYDDIYVSKELSTEEMITIQNIFNGKKLYIDTPSCGFTKNASIILNNEADVFYVACDGCPIIYYKNMEKYFCISDEECSMLHSILENNGFIFPCV